MKRLEKDRVLQAVREVYGRVAQSEASGCGCNPSSCCSGEGRVEEVSLALGYLREDIASVLEGADMGLGCGNPQAIAALKPGETVLDLGSGGGFDCFLAARQVGDSGLVIGVDMTPEMVSRARRNAVKGGYKNVEFRLGEIENLPVADNSVDVIISNCVINLSPDKKKVFREAFRVLKPGGRLAISDIVATSPIPDEVKRNIALYTGCIGGASLISDLEDTLSEIGFIGIRVSPKEKSREFIRDWAPDTDIQDYVVSADIEAVKP